MHGVIYILVYCHSWIDFDCGCMMILILQNGLTAHDIGSINSHPAVCQLLEQHGYKVNLLLCHWHNYGTPDSMLFAPLAFSFPACSKIK